MTGRQKMYLACKFLLKQYPNVSLGNISTQPNPYKYTNRLSTQCVYHILANEKNYQQREHCPTREYSLDTNNSCLFSAVFSLD